MTIQSIFSENLNRLLYDHGRTQLDLARFVGVSNTTVNNWVKGYNTPRMDKIDKICSFFSIQREELLHERSADTINSPDRYPIPTADSLLPLSREEAALVRKYRLASDDTKSAVCAVLGVQRQVDAEFLDSKIDA